jgi:hypothetical protein
MNNIKVFKSRNPKHEADFTTIWTDPQGNDWKVEIDWKASKSGVRIAGMSIVAHGHDIGLTSRILRQLPLGEIGSSERDFEMSQSNDIKKKSFHRGGHRRVELTDLELEKVGMLYVEATNSGNSTQNHIAAYFKISIPTAARRIRLAREKGHIKTNKTRSKSNSKKKKT